MILPNLTTGSAMFTKVELVYNGFQRIQLSICTIL